MHLLEEVAFFMVCFDPDLPVLRIHLNNTSPTTRLTARRYRARITIQVVYEPYQSGNNDEHIFGIEGVLFEP